MKIIYDGREVDRMSVETLNDRSSRGQFFARKLIEFSDGDKLYITERLVAGANVSFLSGDNALIGYLFGAQNIEGKEINCAADVTQGTASGKRLHGFLSMSGGKITMRFSLEQGFTVSAARVLINGSAAADITGLPADTDKNTLIITLNEAVS